MRRTRHAALMKAKTLLFLAIVLVAAGAWPAA
jgi:hypothetical protein